MQRDSDECFQLTAQLLMMLTVFAGEGINSRVLVDLLQRAERILERIVRRRLFVVTTGRWIM